MSLPSWLLLAFSALAAPFVTTACEPTALDGTRPTSQTASPRATAPSVASTTTGPKPSPIDQITEEDFEEDALLEIGADNLEEELDKLEAEIGD